MQNVTEAEQKTGAVIQSLIQRVQRGDESAAAELEMLDSDEARYLRVLK